MNQSASIIPVISETLDIMPGWLKYALFLAVLVAVSTVFWLAGVQKTLDAGWSFIGNAFGFNNFTWGGFVVICFLAVLAMIALYVNRSI